MRYTILSACLMLFAVAMIGLAGCNPPASTSAAASDADFAQGAFPPILSDVDYHEGAWTKTTCLSCHENPEEDAPQVRHVSVPEDAAKVKCRTCHVLVPGAEPIKW